MADPFIRSHINNLPLFARLPAEQIDAVALYVATVAGKPKK